MIGQKFFEIDSKDLVMGVTSGLRTNDGGLSPQTYQCNLTAVPGVLYPPGPIVDESTNVAGEIIASCSDPTYNGKDRFLLDDESNFYWFDVSTTTNKVTSTHSFAQGSTDMVAWYDTTNGINIYATSQAGASGDVVQYNKATGLDETWYSSTVTGGSALSAFTPWRPMLVYEKNLYIGDGNELNRVKPDLTATDGILSLTSTELISALGIDQGSGKMLIATNAGTNSSGTEHQNTRIHVYDGFSNKATRVVLIEGLVTAFKNVGNTTYVFYGNKLGYWTGSGIEFIRTLNFTESNANLIYPHRSFGINNTLYYIDTVAGVDVAGGAAINKQIMAYGEIINGTGKVFYPVLYPAGAAATLTAAFPVRAREIGFAYATDKFYTFDLDDITEVTSGGANITTKQYNFPRDITFNGALIETDQVIPDGEVVATLRVIDSKGNISSSNLGQLNTTRTDLYEWETTIPTIETRSLQFSITLSPSTPANILGIRRITVFYTPKE